MNPETKKAAVLQTTASKNEQHKESYLTPDLLSRRQIKIEKRLADIPKAYKKNYLTAVQGKSLRACINAQCLECMGWQRKEITLCTYLACPLYAVRPYQDSQKNRHYEPFSCAESKNIA